MSVETFSATNVSVECNSAHYYHLLEGTPEFLLRIDLWCHGEMQYTYTFGSETKSDAAARALRWIIFDLLGDREDIPRWMVEQWLSQASALFDKYIF